jgi:drug/metabolite transporter (DMT)-like permease
MSNQAKGAFFTLFGAACWGVSGCIGQYLFNYQGMDSTWLVPIRLFLAGLVMGAFYCIKDHKQFFAPFHSKRNVIDLIIYGVFGVSFSQFLYFFTIQYSSAGVATILQDLFPAIVLIIACISSHRLPHIFEIISIALALFGVFLLTTHGSLTELAISPAALFAGILCAFAVVLYNLWPKNLQKQFSTPILQSWAFLMGGTVALFLFRPWTMHYVPTVFGILGIAGVVLIGNVLAFTCYMQGVKLVGAQKASLYSFAEPVTAAIISTVVLDSPFTIWDGLGFASIFIMLVLLSLPEKDSAKTK